MLDIKDLIETGINDGVEDKTMLMLIAEDMKEGKTPDEIYKDLYKSVYGNHLCKKFCKEMVESMYNAAGEKGCKITYDQVIDSAKRIGITFSGNEDDYTEYELWAAANMMYYDYGADIKDAGLSPEINLMVSMADSYLDDIDGPKGKLMDYFFFVMNNKK